VAGENNGLVNALSEEGSEPIGSAFGSVLDDAALAVAGDPAGPGDRG
jgi:hypothetical protein